MTATRPVRVYWRDGYWRWRCTPCNGGDFCTKYELAQYLANQHADKFHPRRPYSVWS